MRRCARRPQPNSRPPAARRPNRRPCSHPAALSSSGVLAIGDRILAVDGRQLKRRKLCDLMQPQPSHLFKVQRPGLERICPPRDLLQPTSRSPRPVAPRATPLCTLQVQRLGEDAVSNRVSLPQNLREEIEEAKGGRRGLFGWRKGGGGGGGVAEASLSEKSRRERSAGRTGGKGKGKKNNPFVMNDAQYDDWFK